MTHNQPPSMDGMALASWTRTMERSFLRDMIGVVSQPGILSFAGGLPAPDLFPTGPFAEAAASVLAGDPLALQYGPPFAPLKRQIVRLMAARGIHCSEEQIFLTTGAQQGLDVLARLLLDPGSPVLIEEMVYTGVQQAIAPLQPTLLTVPTDLDTGMDVDAVARHLDQGRRPAFIYTISEAHNPLGVSTTPAKRERLVDLARHYRVPIIEDDPYGFLYYGDDPAPPLRAWEDRWVFYLGSFSKILAPALRVGWIVAPPALIPKLTVIKEANDLETSAFMQRAINTYLEGDHLAGHLDRLRGAYRKRRDTMLQALDRYFPHGARWTRPEAGMFIWVELPAPFDTERLLQRAVEEEQVAFIPGHAFSVHRERTRTNCLRLNFSNATTEQIEEGIRRLARLLQVEPRTTG